MLLYWITTLLPFALGYYNLLCILFKFLDVFVFKKSLSFHYRIAIFYVLVSLISIFAIPLFFIFDRGDCVNSKRVSVILRQISYIIGVEWIVRGQEYMKEDKGCVIVMNHHTALDILGLFSIWRYFPRMAAVAKSEIYYFWPFGLSAYLAGVVFIERGNSERARKTLKDATRTVTTEKTKLLLFPEGTRNKERNIGKFKKGAFHLAIEANVPIMPIVISPYFFINYKTKFFGKGPVIIEALPMIPTTGKTVDQLTDHVQQIMSTHYQKLSQEIKNKYPSNYDGF